MNLEKKFNPLSVSLKGLNVKIPISGFFPSFDLMEKSVFSKLPFKKFSIELKKLSLILEVSALDVVNINADNIITNNFLI
jgi:hypothetical protein